MSKYLWRHGVKISLAIVVLGILAIFYCYSVKPINDGQTILAAVGTFAIFCGLLSAGIIKVRKEADAEEIHLFNAGDVSE